ncbi:MAG: zinc ribbon domain-containing protein [Candidatus Omnitrophica bacterium]|nr:zinc ribbon domain-containing protein [Candidatus Omnitrophota bacterium]
MPTYEYECLKCGYRFELLHGINAKPTHACPKCGGGVKKLISSGSGIIFKGSGFYATDYKKKNQTESCPTANNSRCLSCPSAKKDQD